MYWQRCLKVKDGLYSTMYLVGILGVFLLLTHSLYSSLVLNKVVVKNVESLPQNLFFLSRSLRFFQVGKVAWWPGHLRSQVSHNFTGGSGN